MRIILIFICFKKNFKYNTHTLIFNKFFMETIKRINHTISDLTVLAQKVRLCHWNVEGPGFLDYHEFFEELYTSLADNIDEFAERIRALDAYPVATLSEMLELSHLKENANLTSKDMVAELLSDLETISKEINTWLENEEDAVAEGMFTDLIGEIDKKAWMLRAMKKPGIMG